MHLTSPRYSLQTENKKTYESPEEDARRFEIFSNNKKRIDEHNERYKKGEVTWTQGLTNFADLVSFLREVVMVKFEALVKHPINRWLFFFSDFRGIPAYAPRWPSRSGEESLNDELSHSLSFQ